MVCSWLRAAFSQAAEAVTAEAAPLRVEEDEEEDPEPPAGDVVVLLPAACRTREGEQAFRRLRQLASDFLHDNDGVSVEFRPLPPAVAV